MVYPNVQYLGPAYPDRSKPRGRTMTRELASRTSDGIHVRLLWRQCDGQVSVEVNDTKTGEAFELPLHDGERGLDVFHHPYAYAASRRHRASKPSHIASDISLAV
jgi:hypothetical protein